MEPTIAGLPAPAGAAWSFAAQRIGVATDAARRSGDDLDARYAEPHRRYHTGVHVQAVLRDSAGLAADLGVPAADLPVLTLAVCAHDVVYDAQPGDDERASAEWARGWLAPASQRVADRVAGLVLDTLTHSPADDDPLCLALLDADLAILGAAEPDYDAYVRGVRVEYAAVDDDAWRAGRTAVLAGFLERSQLYVSAPARARWETAARANLARELVGLAAP